MADVQELFSPDFQAIFDAVANGTHHDLAITVPSKAPQTMTTVNLSSNDMLRAMALRLFPGTFFMLGKSLHCTGSDDPMRTKNYVRDLYANDKATISNKDKTRTIVGPGVLYSDSFDFCGNLHTLQIKVGKNIMYIMYKYSVLKYVVVSSALRREEYTFYSNGDMKCKAVLTRKDKTMNFSGIVSYYYLPGVPQHIGARENVRALYEVLLMPDENGYSPKPYKYNGLCINYNMDGTAIHRNISDRKVVQHTI